MRTLVVAAALLGACAGPPKGPDAPEPAPPTYAAALAQRLRGIDLGTLTADWPRRSELPKPEKSYDAAFAGADVALCDGWWCDILLDRDDPQVLWVRATGSVRGIREYRGPARVLDDSGPLVLQVGE